MKPPKVFLLLLLLINFMGCAAPQLMSSYQMSDFAFTNKVPTGKGPITINIGELLIPKSLPDPFIVGEAKVGVFNETKPIRSEIPVDKLLTQELNRAFSHAGFEIKEKDRCQYFVTGQIDRFWVDEYATGFSFEYAKASIRYDIVIKNRDNQIVWGKSIHKFEMSGKSMDATEDDIPTLLSALRNSIEDIFKDESFWKTIK